MTDVPADPTPPPPRRSRGPHIPGTRRDQTVLVLVGLVVLSSFAAMWLGVKADDVEKVATPALTLLGVAFRGETEPS